MTSLIRPLPFIFTERGVGERGLHNTSRRTTARAQVAGCCDPEGWEGATASAELTQHGALAGRAVLPSDTQNPRPRGSSCHAMVKGTCSVLGFFPVVSVRKVLFNKTDSYNSTLTATAERHCT